MSKPDVQMVNTILSKHVPGHYRRDGECVERLNHHYTVEANTATSLFPSNWYPLLPATRLATTDNHLHGI